MFDSLEKLVSVMSTKGVLRLYAKPLSKNDNSKNQIYLGNGFSSLNLLPHSPIITDATHKAGSIRDRAKADVRFFWLGKEQLYHAPNAQLILYPKYPEVRMSGFLMGCPEAPSELMRQRLEGRILLIGVTEDGSIIGYLSAPETALTKELLSQNFVMNGVFFDLTDRLQRGDESKTQLLNKLQEIIDLGWIASQKLDRYGTSHPYKAQNGGGYTLEAMFGIIPNGRAAPDFMGWEIKQYAVNNLQLNTPQNAVTVFTPEPTGGFYKTHGVEEFIRRFGYPDKNGHLGRLNFGGTYKNTAGYHHDTQLTLNIDGYDRVRQKITDMNGKVSLVHTSGELASAWSFSKLIERWTTKHSKAVYIPSIKRKSPLGYKYGSSITLHEETDFLFFLEQLSAGHIYLDPGLKLETDKTGKIKTKRRNQFRINHKYLPKLYAREEKIII